MQLRDLKRGQKFKVKDAEDCPVITFHNLDGMYSYCTCEEGTVHLRFDTPVILEEQDDE
jgi:hypothetical protein